jgi:hypothetical protein
MIYSIIILLIEKIKYVLFNFTIKLIYKKIETKTIFLKYSK